MTTVKQAQGRDVFAGRPASRSERARTFSAATQQNVRLVEACVREVVKDSASRGYSVYISHASPVDHAVPDKVADLVVEMDSDVRFVIECKHADPGKRWSFARVFRDWATATDPNHMQATAVGQAIGRSIAGIDAPSAQGRRRALDRAYVLLRKLKAMRVAETG